MRSGFVLRCAAVLIVCLPSAGSGAVFECRDGHGRTIYTDVPVQLQRCRATSVAESSGPSTPRMPSASAEAAVSARETRQPAIMVPLDRAGQLFIVHVRLRSATERVDDAPLILDTGASHTVLSHRLADLLGVQTDSHAPPVTLKTAGGTAQATLARLDTVSVAEAVARDVAVAIHDLPDAPPGVEGLLGVSFFQQFVVTLDSERGTLQFSAR
jgi:clan AA aspartic protease (TIGR02281 family)